METKGRGRPRRDVPSGVPLNAFAIWMRDTGMQPEMLAQMLGRSLVAIYCYRRGSRRPGLRTALKIELISDGRVPVESWVS